MKKTMVLAIILFLSVSSFCMAGALQTPDQIKGTRFIVKNPNRTPGRHEITDSFALIIKGLGEDLLLKDSFEDSGDIEINVKLPVGPDYDFYFIGYTGEVITCYASFVDGLIFTGDASFDVEMKPYAVSFGKFRGEGTHEFREPEYDESADPRMVKWARTSTDVTITGEDLGEFMDGVGNNSHAYFKYSFDTWNGDTFYFYPHTWTEGLPLYREYSFSATETDDLTRTTRVFFPLLYSDDNTTYQYNEAEFELWIPLEIDDLDVGFLCSVALDEQLGSVAIYVK